jgi:hypothetical protein
MQQRGTLAKLVFIKKHLLFFKTLRLLSAKEFYVEIDYYK